MARFIYSWKQTEHGKRLFRRPGTGSASARASEAAVPRDETETTDYGALLKADLVETAEKRGIDSSGTKADIIDRLEQADG